MNEKLNLLETRLVYLSDNIAMFRQELQEYKDEQVSKPSFELSPEIIELIRHTFNEFIDERIIGQLDTNHTAYASGDGFQISIDFDLQECVTDALPSTYRLANDFIDDVISELTSKQEAYEYEQSQITIARIVEHEDQQESENN
jgi:hypothetical protein